MINSRRPGTRSVSSTGSLDRRDDIIDHDRLAAAASGCDAVIHLAAKVGLGVNIGDIDEYALHNDYGTAMALRVAAEAGISRFVYASSMVVYGEGRYRCAEHGSVRPPPRRRDDLDAGRFDPLCPTCGDDLTPELVPESAPLDPRNAYAATKAHGEQLAAIWSRETGGTVARAPVPQRLRPGDAARHPVRRSGVDLHRQPAARRSSAGLRGRLPAAQLHPCFRRGSGGARGSSRPAPGRADAAEHRNPVGDDRRRDGDRS